MTTHSPTDNECAAANSARSQVGVGWYRPQHPAHGVCSIEATGLRGITAQWGHVVSRLKSAKGIIGDGFISCIDTEYYFQKWPFDAAVRGLHNETCSPRNLFTGAAGCGSHPTQPQL